ncbi:virulence protein RhuM/Fic/DOC family protein [Francisella adeliensis]|uniref:Death-on-curing protein n=1 Tax=Francisella adeliensis TaxID=2007306 RepID=A0A2Z4XZG7_9GAMM|nr:virulence protein RhuM/Fic/DOC family protein [Francisella adeliensis]AXA34154.1 death-on-curing protein [Francisella adeliensis]MBK2085538.1 virulence protein RhuM/Fic/DOC family protein [Francisella adeliensis]MBK2096340.1 virulence protein RhuM/Fic/DOC family protein [Francisella adeliensis]QIW12398.1 Fic/DOC family protein [Francisella adeliensis]QIW14272.1 Fic/DOC family protein [Francisella adeliensis]
MSEQKDLIIYQLESGALELKADFSTETVWASQKDISLIYGKDQSVISRHIRNIFKDGEVDEKSNMQKMHIANSDKPVVYYSLDIVLAVGYRVSSAKAIMFRKWATQTLKKHITNGYTINKSRVEKDPKFLLEVVTSLNEMSNKKLNSDDTLELIKTFSYTWFSLQSYDEQKFPKTHSNIDIELSVEKLYKDLANLKESLISKKEATMLFAQEKTKGSLDSIFKNVFQDVFGQELYPSIEEKSAHLLYFIVKNHPFNDGNKRSGAYAFIWMLKSFNYNHRITPETLATLTILIAESSPNDKDKMIGMVLLLLAGQKNVI